MRSQEWKAARRDVNVNVAFRQQAWRGGYSLLEILAVVAIVAIIATLAVGQFFSSADDAKRNACYINKGEIAVQAQLWFRNKGSWPAADLSDIGSNTAYFPAGVPACPVNGTDYTFDPNTQEIVGHAH